MDLGLRFGLRFSGSVPRVFTTIRRTVREKESS